MHENELIYMNIHLDEYFHIMIVKVLMFHLSNKKLTVSISWSQLLKPTSRVKFLCLPPLVVRNLLLFTFRRENSTGSRGQPCEHRQPQEPLPARLTQNRLS